MTVTSVIVFIMIVWSIVGFVTCMIAICSSRGALSMVEGFEFVNPYWIYKNYRVNYLGVLVLFLLYNLMCPIASLCYWFYKLCTFGRKN